MEKYIKKVKIAVAFLFLSGASLLLPAAESAQEMLFRAAQSNNIALAEQALKAGADINGKDTQGLTPLHFAVKNNNKEMVQLLINAGVNKDLQNQDGDTPLHFAARGRAGRGNREMTRLLLNAGANTNIQDNYGTTPLMIAVVTLDPETVTLFLEKGADLSIMNNEGITARNIAQGQGFFPPTQGAKAIEDYIEARKKVIQEVRPEVYPVITEEIEEFEFGK